MMEGWKTDKFKNQIQYKSGYTWSKEQELKTQEPNSVRVLTVTNIQKELDLSEELYLQGVSEKDKKEKAVSKDWCIAVSSNGNRKRIGNAVFIKDDTDYLFASFLTAFKPKDNSDVLPDYFFRWLTSHNVQERITSVSEGTTGLGNLDIRYLRNMDIHFPEKQEQTAIAAMLSKVDETIASVQASIAAAERLKKSLMQNLLTGRMKPDGTLRKENEFYVDEKFGRVPLGWEVKKVGEIAENLDNLRKPIKSIDRDKIKGKIPYYGAAGIVDYINDYLFDGTYLLFGEDGENLLSRKVPQAFIVKGKFWVNNHAHILRVYNEFDINLIVNILESKKYDDIVYGSAQPKINKSDLNSIKIIIPKDIDEQKRISKSITTIDIEISTKQSKIAVLERLKKSLMQNLLTGVVRIK